MSCFHGSDHIYVLASYCYSSIVSEKHSSPTITFWVTRWVSSWVCIHFSVILARRIIVFFLFPDRVVLLMTQQVEIKDGWDGANMCSAELEDPTRNNETYITSPFHARWYEKPFRYCAFVICLVCYSYLLATPILFSVRNKWGKTQDNFILG